MLWLLCLLAAGAALGVVVPQGLEEGEYARRYGEAAGGLVVLLGLNRVFTAWWFVLPATLLAVSLIACSRRLWLLSYGRWKLPDAAGAAGRWAAGEQVAQARVGSSPEEARRSLAAAARRRGRAAHILGEAKGAHWLCLSRRRWAHWGTALTHYSLFLIAIGAILGRVPGIAIDTQIRIVQGDTYQDPEGALPFALRLDDFEIRLDPDTGAVGNYYSDVTVLEDGKEVLRRRIAVNRHLEHRGVMLTQSSWGIAGVRLEVTVEDETHPVEFPLFPDEVHGGWMFAPGSRSVLLPDHESALAAIGFLADAERRGEEVLDRGTGVVGTPALLLAVISDFEAGGHDITPLEVVFAGESAAMPGGEVRFVEAVAWTGLGVRRDPGLWLVWLGFIGCTLGMVLIFYLRPEQATARLVEAQDGAVEITIARAAGRDATDHAAAVWTQIAAEAAGEASARGGPFAKEASE